MDETLEQLLAKLEQATAPATSDPVTTEPPDDETAMLRESWLAFGQLLDAADVESKSVARPQPVPRAGLSFRFVAALAASLLVAIVVWTIMKRGTDVLDQQRELAIPDQPAAAVVEDVAEVSPGSESADVVDEFAWEDSFDEQLADTSQAIRSVQADWHGGDRRYAVLLDQFEQFDEEISEGSL